MTETEGQIPMRPSLGKQNIQLQLWRGLDTKHNKKGFVS